MELDLLVELIGRRVADQLEMRFCSWERDTAHRGYSITIEGNGVKAEVFLTTEFIEGTDLNVITAFMRKLVKREIRYVEKVSYLV